MRRYYINKSWNEIKDEQCTRIKFVVSDGGDEIALLGDSFSSFTESTEQEFKNSGCSKIGRKMAQNKDCGISFFTLYGKL
jgi:hypothetical protein